MELPDFVKTVQSIIDDYQTQHNIEIIFDRKKMLLLIGDQFLSLMDLFKWCQYKEDHEEVNTQICLCIDKCRFAGEPTPLSEVSHRIFPRIFNEAKLAETQLPYIEFLGDMITGFVVDGDLFTASVTSTHLVKWDIDIYDLSELATENLKKLSNDKLEIQILSGETVALIDFKDGYTSSRILLPKYLQELAIESIETKEYFVSIPCRDVMFIFRKSLHNDQYRKLKIQLKKMHDNLPYSISNLIMEGKLDGMVI